MRVTARFALAIGAFILTLCLVEGVSSAVLLLHELWREGRVVVAERKHTTYDRDLGWANAPGKVVQDMYGPGTSMHINGQGFRGTREVEREVPPGKVRVVCSGDSFTLGYGVDDEDAWVHRLGVLDAKLETVNMGQGGYGLDQAFLWYRRDGAALEHDVHVFAFISDDFKRMQHASFYGYPKPVLRVAEGELVVDGVPVPRFPYRFPFLTQNSSRFERLKTAELLHRLRGTSSTRLVLDDRTLEATALAVFEELARINSDKGSVLVAVHLPTRRAHGNEPDEWSRLLAEELPRRGIHYVDLAADLRELPAGDVAALFIKRGEVDYPGAVGHYSAAGNLWAAETVLTRLRGIRAVAERLGRD